MSVKKFVDNIFVTFRDSIAYPVTSVFACNVAAHIQQTINSGFVPLCHITLCLADFFNLLHRVVYQCGKDCIFLGSCNTFQCNIDFFADNTRRIVEYMQKCLVFAVDVAHIHFGAFWQL